MQKERVVIKIGSSLLTSESGCLNSDRIASLCQEIAGFYTSADKPELILVSSGAIVAGSGKLGWCTTDGKVRRKDLNLREKQAAAAIGQVQLMHVYETNFNRYKISVAQVLLTRADIEDRSRYLNVRNTLLTLLSLGVIPIINENDAVAVDEIQFGDNDTLAALVAGKVAADKLIILSDVDGLYTSNPEKPSSEIKLIPTVNSITSELETIAGKEMSSSGRGTGGMWTKVQAAKIATMCGVEMYIINGHKPGLLSRAVCGEDVGTKFIAHPSKLPARDRWLIFGARVKGKLGVDDGAVRALTQRGKSLLPSGITCVEGNFQTGDVVSIVTSDGKEIGRGLTNYSYEEVQQIRSCQTNRIVHILGYKGSSEVIHRDNMVIF